MILRIKKTDIRAFALIFLIFTYSFTKAGIHNYIYPNSIICYLSFVLIIVIASRIGTTSSLRKCTLLESLLLLCSFILICNRNYNFANGKFEDGLSFIAITLFFVFVRTYNSWHKFVIPVMAFWVAVHTIVTLMEYAIPGFYMEKVFPLMPDYAEMHLRSVFKLGYMPGLAVHYSTNGMYLGIGLIVAGIALLFSSHKKRKKINILYVIIVAIALLLTGKRASIIFSTVSLVMVYYIYNSNKPLNRFGKLFLLAIVVMIAFYIGSVFIPSLSNFIDRFIETSEAGDVSLGRIKQSAIALNIFFKNWILGGGWDSFKYLYKAQFGILLNVHNIYIQLLCENGVLGAMPFFAFFIVAMYRAIKSLIYLRKHQTGKYPTAEMYLGFSIAMQSFFLLYGITGNPLYDQQVFYPYIVTVAAGEFYEGYVAKNKNNSLTDERR